jgi:transposase
MGDVSAKSLVSLPDTETLACVDIRTHPQGFIITLTGRRVRSPCPKCGVESDRVHARYQRALRDLPIQGRRVSIRLESRKFICTDRDCQQRIHCERFGKELPAYARFTRRLLDTLARLALCTSANLTHHLTPLLGLCASSSTILRAAHQFEPPTPTEPLTHVGIDDFSLRRGRTYGTLIINHLTQAPIERLPGREKQPVMEFLQAHPGIQVATRDRHRPYANAIVKGAPNAIAVADRWHLIRNLSDAFERLVATHRDYLITQWNQGCKNAAHHYRELKKRGYQGKPTSVRSYLQPWRHHPPTQDQEVPFPTLPASRTLTWNLLTSEHDPITRQRHDHVPDAQYYTRLAQEGIRNIATRNHAAHQQWCQTIQAGADNALKRFVRNLADDHDAIQNAFSTPLSNGLTEGHVNRLKLPNATATDARASTSSARRSSTGRITPNERTTPTESTPTSATTHQKPRKPTELSPLREATTPPPTPNNAELHQR